MCLARAYLNKPDGEPVLKDIARLQLSGPDVVMETLFGEIKTVKGRLSEVDFENSTLLIETIPHGGPAARVPKKGAHGGGRRPST
jgi:predicted RNA-binding protein